MALNEAALRKFGKEEIIKLALKYQSKFESTLSGINGINILIPLIPDNVDSNLDWYCLNWGSITKN